ncbi:hypothetical protein P3T35_001884 [Kitasatospora sp. GP30]|nr:hypothetical protein [Kitasatospora sp. GP30]
MRLLDGASASASAGRGGRSRPGTGEAEPIRGIEMDRVDVPRARAAAGAGGWFREVGSWPHKRSSSGVRVLAGGRGHPCADG